ASRRPPHWRGAALAVRRSLPSLRADFPTGWGGSLADLPTAWGGAVAVGGLEGGQDERPGLGDRPRVLEVGRKRAVGRADRPAVGLHEHLERARVHHG